MLGSEIEPLLKADKIEYIGTDREVDITKGDEIARFVSGKEIKWIINAAAYTNVDGAEAENKKAFSVNSLAVQNLANIAKNRGIKMIHISTDYVFDGLKQTPYTEDDPANPQSVYGKSKLEGETLLRSILKKHFVIRTSWLYGKSGKNFVKTILGLLKTDDEIKVVNDQLGSPTSAADLAEVIVKTARGDLGNYGVYHFSNEGTTTWFEFAKTVYEIAEEIGLIHKTVNIFPVSTKEYPTAAARPKYSVLSKDKIKREMNVMIRDWRQSLREFLLDIKICGN